MSEENGNPKTGACNTTRQLVKLSVLIPVYNEARTIDEILRLVAAVPIEKEILVVDDGSTDGTREILGALGRARRACA